MAVRKIVYLHPFDDELRPCKLLQHPALCADCPHRRANAVKCFEDFNFAPWVKELSAPSRQMRFVVSQAHSTVKVASRKPDI